MVKISQRGISDSDFIFLWRQKISNRQAVERTAPEHEKRRESGVRVLYIAKTVTIYTDLTKGGLRKLCLKAGLQASTTRNVFA